MSEFVRVDPRGNLVPENEETRSRLSRQGGRYYLAPTSPDWLVGVRAPSQGGVAEGVRVILAGDLSGVPLPDLIAFISQSRLSGVLRIVAPNGERAVVLKSGEVRGAASDDPADAIGQIAVRLGLLPAERLEQVLAAGPHQARLGRVLVEEGLLQPHDLWRCLQQQVAEVFHEILMANQGAFMLVDQPIEDRGGLSLNTQGLLMDAIRRIDEMKEFRKRLPSSKSYVVRKKPATGLEPNERLVYDLCDGERTVADIAQAARLPEFEATKILHHLIEGGFAAASAAPQKAPSEQRGATAEEVARVFNFVFKEIVGDVRKVSPGTEFLAAANGALAGQAAESPALKGLSFSADGSLPEGQLLGNLATLSLPPADAAKELHAELSKLMFFLLFETSELLDPKSDEDLSRRVKQLLSTIEGVG